MSLSFTYDSINVQHGLVSRRCYSHFWENDVMDDDMARKKREMIPRLSDVVTGHLGGY